MARHKAAPELLRDARLKKKRQNDIKLDRKIAALQNTDIALIPKLPFSRLVREIMGQYKENYRITAIALVISQTNSLIFFYVEFSKIIVSGGDSRSVRILFNISVQRCIFVDLSSKTSHSRSFRYSNGVAYSSWVTEVMFTVSLFLC